MAFKSETIQRFSPMDDNPTWGEIYDRLSAAIGAPHAYSWFAHCRFVRLQSDTLELSHWNAFSARECLHKFGEQLCAAANVNTIRMNRTGGSKPVTVETMVSNRRGFELFYKPQPRMEPIPAQDTAA